MKKYKYIVILRRIVKAPESFKRLLMLHAQRHAEKQANGEYYYNEDIKKWEGYIAEKGIPSIQKARVGRARDKDIQKRICILCGTDYIPSFITYNGDPRGFVLKIQTDKLTDDEKQYCEENNLMRDFGGDYAIVQNGTLDM